MHKALLLPMVGFPLMPDSLLSCLVWAQRMLLFGTKKKKIRICFSIWGKFESLQHMVGKEKRSLRPTQSEVKIPHLGVDEPLFICACQVLTSAPSAESTDTEKQTRQCEPGPWAPGTQRVRLPIKRSGKIKCCAEKQQGVGTACASPCKARAHCVQEPLNCAQQDFYQHHGAASEVSLLHSN